MSKDIYAVDANVILRFLLRDDEPLFEKASSVMHAVQDNRLKVLCDPVIFAEVVWVLQSFYKLPAAEISHALKPILSAESFLIVDKDIYLKALDLYSRQNPHFGDACACARAIASAGGNIVSFDRKLGNSAGVKRIEELPQ